MFVVFSLVMVEFDTNGLGVSLVLAVGIYLRTLCILPSTAVVCNSPLLGPCVRPWEGHLYASAIPVFWNGICG